MTTTMVRDSVVGDQWLKQTMAQAPITRIMDQKTGMFKGDLLTGPVRLAFENVFELPKPKANEPNKILKFGSSLLFPPLVDFSILYEEYYKACGQFFPEYWDAPTQQFSGLHSPFHPQEEKLKWGGFTPGCVYINSTSKFKPPIVDARLNPIVDRTKVYAGVWAICAINAYPYGKNPPQPKKGIGFGLQSVMIIGDDTKFGTGGPDAKAAFAGINVAAPIVRPEMMNGMPVGNPMPPAAGIPGYTMPGGGVGQPLPQTHYTGAPMHPVPSAPPSPEDDMSWLNA